MMSLRKILHFCWRSPLFLSKNFLSVRDKNCQLSDCEIFLFKFDVVRLKKSTKKRIEKQAFSDAQMVERITMVLGR